MSRLLFYTTYILTGAGGVASGGNKSEMPPFLFLFIPGSEVVSSVAGWQDEDGSTWRIFPSLLFVVSNSGKKPPVVVLPAILSFVSGSRMALAKVTSGRLDFHKQFLHAITFFLYSVLISIVAVNHLFSLSHYFFYCKLLFQLIILLFVSFSLKRVEGKGRSCLALNF